MRSIKNKNLKSGFTLIETMIAIALFTIIMTIGIGAVLQTNNVYKKTQTLRSVTDNLDFVMEDMARNLRLGGNYSCPASTSSVISVPFSAADCPNSSSSIAFQAVDGSVIVYIIGTVPSDPNSNVGIYKSKDGGANFVRLTPDEVTIDQYKSGFTVVGSAQADGFQPRVTIRLSGTVTYKAGLSTDFNLETSVSQRLLDS